MLRLFSFTLFLSAFLLFWVQLTVAKMILPLLGGSPGVWNTCQFFFQVILLLGYGYSHFLTNWLSDRHQVIIHSSLLFFPLLFLPISISPNLLPPQNANPIPWLLILLLLSVGLPFFVVSTSAPLLQKWFANTNHSSSDDPYFLYGASNLGSMLSLLLYPVVIETNISLINQSKLWAIGYIFLVLFIGLCAIFLWKFPRKKPNILVTTRVDNNAIKKPSIQIQLQWILWAFLPSSLVLGVTNYITTDLAAIPLLWAIPLAIYLLTFILTFARQPILPQILNPSKILGILPLLLTTLIIISLLKIIQGIWLLVPLHLLGFFIAAYVCHGELAKSRPSSAYLTLFYLWVSVGGVLGGLFNAIAAPLLFKSVLEYPLIMILILLLLRDITGEKLKAEQIKLQESARINAFFGEDIAAKISTPVPNISNITSTNFIFSLSKTWPLSIGVLIGSLIIGFDINFFTYHIISIIVGIALVLTIYYTFNLKFWRLLVGVILILLLNQFSILDKLGGIIASDRSFFGVSKVLYDKSEKYHSFLHGTTLHGKQSLEPQRRGEPLTYFYPTGPIGQIFQFFKTYKPHNIGVLGLGIGTLAAYSETGQNWNFYEIDPIVETIARDTRYFTFLADAKAKYSIILGDARLRLTEIPDNSYDVIFMDAFSSDSIPVHLITKEAIELYFRKLTPNGLLIINITNRHLNLAPVIATLAKNLGLSTLQQWEKDVSEAEKNLGKAPSHWVLLARNQDIFGSLLNDKRWQPILENYQASLWTDDFSNIFSTLRIFHIK